MNANTRIYHDYTKFCRGKFMLITYLFTMFLSNIESIVISTRLLLPLSILSVCRKFGLNAKYLRVLSLRKKYGGISPWVPFLKFWQEHQEFFTAMQHAIFSLKLTGP